MRVRTRLVLLLCLLVCGGCGQRKSTDELLQDLKGAEERDRLIAVRLLPLRKEEAARIVPALIDAVKNKAVDVRLSAAIGLGTFGEEAKEKAAERLRRQEIDRRSREADRKRREIQAQIAVLQGQLEESDILIQQEIEREDKLAADRNAMASSRRVTLSGKSAAKMSGKPKPRLVQE